MGCGFFEDPDVKRVLDKLKTEGKEIAENSLKERVKAEAEKACKLSERNSDFSTMKTQSKDIPESKIHISPVATVKRQDFVKVDNR